MSLVDRLNDMLKTPAQRRSEFIAKSLFVGTMLGIGWLINIAEKRETTPKTDSVTDKSKKQQPKEPGI